MKRSGRPSSAVNRSVNFAGASIAEGMEHAAFLEGQTDAHSAKRAVVNVGKPGGRTRPTNNQLL
jgi:uncharacterized protein (DUF302 family)